MKPYLKISDVDIKSLGISPSQCVAWAKEAFLHKTDCILSPKTSQKPTPDSFFNTMPCCLPSFNAMGVKLVSRLPRNIPPLKSTLTLFDMTTGDLISLVEANWITSMRTGAVAALAARTFIPNFSRARFAFVGLGNIARAVFRCVFSQLDESSIYDVWLLKYKDTAERFIDEFRSYKNVRFHVTDSKEALVSSTDALFSCVTVMNDQFLPPDKYPAGYTLIPVHTKGFQDCDLVFDQIFGDDLDHERCFKNFSYFRSFKEIGAVLRGEVTGRLSDGERVICYNVGIALQDVWFAVRIVQMIEANAIKSC